MKIAFDENIPRQMVRVFRALGQEKRFKKFQFVSAVDYTPKLTDPDYEKYNDVPWLTRFANDGGRVVVSGDVAMLDQPHERAALAPFTVFMFERQWGQWDFYQKTSVLLLHWPLVAAKLNAPKVGKVWCFPGLKMKGKLLDVTLGSTALSRTNPGQSVKKNATTPNAASDGAKTRRRIPPRTVDDRQGAFELLGGRGAEELEK